MKHINPKNLPESFVKAVSADIRRPKLEEISVTELIKPPQMRALEFDHWTEIEIDVASQVFALLGTSTHYILKQSSDSSAQLEEERMYARINGTTNMVLTGQVDRLDEDGTLTDYKVAGIFAYVKGDSADWARQLNYYAALCRANGYEVNKLQIVLILRDWKWREAMTKSDYPDSPAQIMEIELWSNDKAVEEIKTRMMMHRRAIEESKYSECTDNERWARDHKWAVVKRGGKRATKLFLNEEDADTLCQSLQKTKKDDYIVEFRPAESVRCMGGFCNAKPWCKQWNKMNNGAS